MIVASCAYFATWVTDSTQNAEQQLVQLVSRDDSAVATQPIDLVSEAHLVCSSRAPENETVLKTAARLDVSIPEARRFVDHSQAFCASLP